MELVAMLLLLGAVGGILLWPLLRRSAPEAQAAGGAPAGDAPDGAGSGDATGARALAAIKELEFDYATGKLDDADYKTLRARYDARAVAALMSSEARSAEGAHPEVRSAEALRRPEGKGPEGAPAVMDDLTARLEAEIRAARGRRFCAQCGGVVPRAARFCPSCGASLEVSA